MEAVNSLGVLIFVFVFLARGAAQDAANSAHDAQKKALEILKDEKKWTEPKAPRDLIHAIEFAKIARLVDAASILVKHINYLPSSRALAFSAGSSDEDFYPAFDAVISLGNEAVPSIIDRLKSPEPTKDAINFLVLSLVKIYNKGGFGKQLAIERIRLEMDASRGKEKARLAELLRNKFLK